jgi:hypothetical protein
VADAVVDGFSRVGRDGDVVTKRLPKEVDDAYRVLGRCIQASADDLVHYLSDLSSIGVATASVQKIADSPDGLEIAHEWVPGPTVLEIAHDPSRFGAAIVEIGSWARRSESVNARVDSNLENFVATDTGPVLVDFLPPLVPTMAVEPRAQNIFDDVFYSLCFDVNAGVNALVSYACRGLLRCGSAGSGDACIRIAGELRNDVTPASEFSRGAAWFELRARAVECFLSGEVGSGILDDVLAATSVRKLRDADPEMRRTRWDRVQALCRDFDLAVAG